MPEVYGPQAPQDFRVRDAPMSLAMPLPANPFSDLLRRLVVMGYGGKPLHQSFLDVHAVAEHRPGVQGWDRKMDNLATTRNPLYGGKLEYRPESWRLDTPIGPVQGAANLDFWHQQPDFPVQRQTGGRTPYTQSLDALTANILGRLPFDNGWTPYLGAGAAAVRTQQGDHLGFSAPTVNLGAHVFAGIDKAITDRISAFLETKYLKSAVTPEDQQGSLRGTFDEMAGVAGLTYRFGSDE